MHDPANRDDISRFVVHLTRDYEGSSGRDNLISILADKVIEARTAHCLFSPLFNRMEFTNVLKSRFKTVCFTETPLNQVNHLCVPIVGRRIRLKPYGLVFYKSAVLKRGGSPAIYINSRGTQIRDYLLQEFRHHFNDIKSLRRFAVRERQYHEQIIQYYSLINIIASNHDFAWEREWRYSGDFKFKYFDVIAIIATNPDRFLERCDRAISSSRMRLIQKIPIISPKWNYEQIVEAMSCSIWDASS